MPDTYPSIVSPTATALMDNTQKNQSSDHQLKVRLLFGLFEADAKGALAIAAALVFLVLLGAGRAWQLW
ncbi:hypothetical protein [Methylobacterium sp. 1030]|uniref:hypothetical protein n=1 Tax=Methylobacterium sp. 1030 TaxID=3156404 RepID=UPI0033965076